MNRKSVIAMAVVIGCTVALFSAVYAIQYYQSRFTRTISQDTAIAIVADRQNLTNYDSHNYVVRYVNIKGNGTVFSSDLETNAVGQQIGMAQPTVRGIGYFAWEVENRNDNSTYYVDSKSGDVVSQSAR